MGNNRRTCTLIDRFSLTERIVMRSGWLGFMAVAIFGIAKQDPLWAWAYGAWGLLGFALAVLPGICAHCPYPTEHATCLFMPPGLVKKFYPYQGPEITATGKIAAFIALSGMVVPPLFWLIDDPVLLIAFLVLCLPVLAAFPLYYCRRCRNSGCPMNKARFS